MVVARHGIWQCPFCDNYQIWKTRNQSTIKLDRQCEKCHTRARVTIDRSNTGQGRNRSVNIWERPITVTNEQLTHEITQRNKKLLEIDHLDIKSLDSKQSVMPTIWGESWIPKKSLLFTSKLSKSEVINELLRFVAERHDGHLNLISEIWSKSNPIDEFNGQEFHTFSINFIKNLDKALEERLFNPSFLNLGESEIIPRRDGNLFLKRRASRFLIDISLCLRRLAHKNSITMNQRLTWQKWMLRTRILDDHLKDLFTNGISLPDGGKFTGKGFRSTWQEGIVACASALRNNYDANSENIDFPDAIAPMIRDTGLALAMGQTPLEIFSAQMGKSGSYMDGGHSGYGGRDLHIGNWEKGILPPTAPLPIASATLTGVALASNRLHRERFHLAPVGEGCSSSGEFWEAMNFAGARGLPICYMIQNNQIALDTFSASQSGSETYGDKGIAMGIPSWTIDGSDPAQFFSSTAVAREFSLDGGGATLIHVETMRGCGHAHHHDDLYLGAISGNPPGYVGRDLLNYWSLKDPIPNHHNLLISLGVNEKELENIQSKEEIYVKNSRKEMEHMPWPEAYTVTKGITSFTDAPTHAQQIDRLKSNSQKTQSPLSPGEYLIKFSDASNSWTFSRAIQNSMVALADKYSENIIFMGEDMEIAGAFGMNLSLKAKGHSDKLLDMPLSESIIINSATGAALGGLRPIAEIQFGGFAALAMNALVNNAAQLRWRWGASVPLTVRIPLGGKTRSGPFHANMIESWFSNDPGLIIVFPSNPQDAFDMLIEGHALPDPVVFLEHLGLYGLRGGTTGWGDNINQLVNTESVHKRLANGQNSIGQARVIRGGNDITIVTWGAMVHVALKAAKHVAKEKIEVEVIDLRTLLPFDSKTCVQSVCRTSRLIVLQESQWTGGFAHTISSRILEETFWNLESPPVVIGALDTPVPFSPPLEDYTIPTYDLVIRHIRSLCTQ
ncbi:thiamine pyrophosphate-dependent enzyme [Euryarchaeota archaeon]|nr:thiamine pyrophosphate-dependent enzyme [Euryarchaeota archaeon]